MDVFNIDSGYSYAWGLVSGLHGRLLKRRDFDLMMQATSVEEVISSLEGTTYGEGFRTIKIGYNLVDIEAVVYSQFKKSYVEITSAIPESDKEMLDSLMLSNWDLENIKTAIRGINSSAPQKEIEGMLFPQGRITKNELKNILTSNNVEELPGKLQQPYSTIVSKAMPKIGNPLEFEEEIDRYYLTELLTHLKGDVRDYLSLHVDALNIRTILRCRIFDVEPDKHVLNEGYYISPNKLIQLLRQDIHGIAKLLEDTPYAFAVTESLQQPKRSIHDLDMRLKKVLTREVEYKATLKPLSVNSVIAYIKAKESEAKNLRIILAGKWYKLSADELKVIIT